MEVSQLDAGAWLAAAAPLIREGRYVQAICIACNRAYAASDIRAEDWSYYHGPKAAGAGERWNCPVGHELFSLTHWVS